MEIFNVILSQIKATIKAYAEVAIEPPQDGNISEEDSGDEDFGGTYKTYNNLSSKQ